MANSDEKTVTISRKEYQSLKASAELIRYPDVLRNTLDELRSEGPKVSLEDAFKE